MATPNYTVLIIEDEKNISDFMSNGRAAQSSWALPGQANGTKFPPWTWAQTITSPSPSARPRCWQESVPPCATATGWTPIPPCTSAPTAAGGFCKEIHLTQIEYKIVAFLARNSGKVMTYSAIMSNVWGPFTGDNNRILRVNMANIRRKIEQNPSKPQFLFTEVGVGYRMREDENELC